MRAENINTLEDAERYIEGVINDFEYGLADKAETMKAMAEYTGRLNELFWNNAKIKIRENPELP